ncbi:LysR family transcriptional regulator [Serratia fonticola]|jgi:DNA-binding transcriptional LysR family regulator|uniref:LysR family transcriptional regulator n=1 Tax=Serratia fonticola TaxID=47917 RepID=A0A542BTR0_SERFO|nr:LysR family transcriptional regulator [Serratia fonticola]TQI81966.1 LysR family transcriptional regulator [Serratia fonticola]TQI96011.1 DNA-binding transcriptional LysR family regulator [Serratia fonticola]TVZ70508.1 LysR family transcriptional regulator [Serratia fonticola]
MDRITAAEVFVTIVDRGSMIAAAETLAMSRAMVTRYLAQMEQWAGARLLHRTTRKLSLTDAGERTLERCRQILALAEDIDLVESAQSDDLRGLLRITCSQSLGQTALVGAVAQYLKRHPQVAVDLQMNNRTVNLVEERIDLALRITNELDPNLIARPLSTCASVICASPAYLAAHGTPRYPQDLSLHNCLTYSYFGKSLWHFEHQGTKSAVAVSGNLSANESVVLLAGTLQGAGISLQPYYSAAPLLAKGDLIELLPEYLPQAMGIYGIYTSRRQMPATLRTMLDFLVEWFATDPGWRATLR